MDERCGGHDGGATGQAKPLALFLFPANANQVLY